MKSDLNSGKHCVKTGHNMWKLTYCHLKDLFLECEHSLQGRDVHRALAIFLFLLLYLASQVYIVSFTL